MRKIAIYGKGGIGKSTVSANLSAALADMGKRVVQIGCDPKHDSTRLLLGMTHPQTVLSSLRKGEDGADIDSCLLEGYKKTLCIEAGGPEPGVGCAGRGILTTFELLKKHHVLESAERDYVIYDVLGDVVCGGFAVPLRKEYAQSIYIVTSGEFMSIYAANNIIRGIKNYETDMPRIGGIIFNSRGAPYEMERVERFSEAVRVPIIAAIPRDERILESEKRVKPAVELFPQSDLSAVFEGLANKIDAPEKHYRAHPVDEDELETLILSQDGNGCKDVPTEKKKRSHDYSGMATRKGVTYDCAFLGAIRNLVQIKDAAIVAHAPQSCGAIARMRTQYIGLVTMQRNGYNTVSDMGTTIFCTDLDESAAIHGGAIELEKTLEMALATRPGAVFVVSSCVSGMIGENTATVIDAVQKRHMDTPIMEIESEGVFSGGGMQGIFNTYDAISAGLMESCKDKTQCSVNLIAELPTQISENHTIIRAMLEEIGISINSRFIHKTSVEDIRSFEKAKLNLLARADQHGSTVKKILERHSDIPFSSHPFPYGFSESSAWLSDVASFFGKEDAAKEAIASHKKRYLEHIKDAKKDLEEKTVMIFTPAHDIDWLLEILGELGMKVKKACIYFFINDETFLSRYADTIDIETDYDISNMPKDIELHCPDLVLTSTGPTAIPDGSAYEMLSTDTPYGFYTGLELADRWSRALKLPAIEGWKKNAQ